MNLIPTKCIGALAGLGQATLNKLQNHLLIIAYMYKRLKLFQLSLNEYKLISY